MVASVPNCQALSARLTDDFCNSPKDDAVPSAGVCYARAHRGQVGEAPQPTAAAA